MEQNASVVNNPATCVQWMWKSNNDPWSKTEKEEWTCYSDVENEMIEEAFTAKRTYIVLDDYHINFEHNVQVSNIDEKVQRPIKRVVSKRDSARLREERFLPNPITPSRPFNDQYGWVSLFIIEVRKYLKLKYGQLPAQDKTVIPMVVEKAALGIIEEGKNAGKQLEAEWMANELMKQKDKKMEEVWKCCAHLYTMESFLYKKLNETMRLVGLEGQEKIWQNKIPTLGPFSLLLWNNPYNTMPAKGDETLYRGATLPDSLITSFKQKSQNPSAQGSFQAFTSSSRNRAKAEQFGNVLFIMQMKCAYTMDLSPLSDYGDEAEELIHPGVSFTVERVEFDEAKNKHLIYLNLAHRHADSRTSKKTTGAGDDTLDVLGDDFGAYDRHLYEVDDFYYDLYDRLPDVGLLDARVGLYRPSNSDTDNTTPSPSADDNAIAAIGQRFFRRLRSTVDK